MSSPVARIGIIGGGQLARMMVLAARRLGCWTAVLDPTAGAPAAQVSDEALVGSVSDPGLLAELASRVDVLTFDLEAVDVQPLLALQADGAVIRPDPAVLARVQDKFVQKTRLTEAGIPTLAFVACDEPSEAAFAEFGYPLVQKARKGGYDGRGVAILRGPEDFAKHLPVPSHLERFVSNAREISVLVARGADGDVRCYPPSEMLFRPGLNMLDLLFAPAKLSPELQERVVAIGVATVEAFDVVGIVGVELFLDEAGQVFVNELAPRPHNSGHHTFEACATDQFEQHLRAILGFPLGSTEQFVPAALVNLLGAEGPSGPPVVRGLREALALPGVSVHLYGKKEARPHRKLGHVTIVDRDLDAACERARIVRDTIVITGSEA